MKESIRQAIKEAIKHAPAMYSRLVLLVGPSGSGKTHALQEISFGLSPAAKIPSRHGLWWSKRKCLYIQ
jgi:chromosomal replication initiation ATPase DnaA